MKVASVFLLLMVGFIIWLFVRQEKNHEKELESLRKQHLREMNNEKARAEEWRQRALEYGNAFRKEATRAQKAETNYNYAREQNEILKRKVIRYSNAGLDSAFSARYGN